MTQEHHMMVRAKDYLQIDGYGLSIRFGIRATYQPCIIGLVRHGYNSVRFNIGGVFVAFSWPLWLMREKRVTP